MTLNCPIYKRCGGCQLLHLTYDETLKKKVEVVEKAFKSIFEDITLDHIKEAKTPYAYRNKMQITLTNQGQRIVGGFYEENSHRVVVLDHCLMHTDNQNEIAKGVVEIGNTLRLKAYDEDRRIGLLRHILIKEAFATKEIMLVLVVASEVFPARGTLVKAIRSRFPQITTIIQNINSRKTSIVLGEKERVLFGKGFIEEDLMGLRFKITSKSFFQVNPEQTKHLYGIAKTYANVHKTEVIIDAYAGVGTIGMILSHEALEVICVENNKAAVSAAINNARDNKIRNVKMVLDDATMFLEAIAREQQSFDVLVMDPPRSGATERFLKAVLQAKPKRIVYVSCDVHTLVRDIAILKHQYVLKKVSLVDMFSWTEHVETIVLLSLK